MYNKFIAEGEKCCIELLRNQKFSVHAIYLTQELSDANTNVLKNFLNCTHYISEKEMAQISALKTHSNILCVFEKLEETLNESYKNIHSVIYLDKIQDPGNLGTIIRISDWYGIEMVVRSAECADFYNPKVVQASMGSISNVTLITCQIDQLADFYPNNTIYGTYLNGISIFEEAPQKKAIMIIGNEGKGISPETESYIQKKISIPGSTNRVADSLNAAVATGIICSIWKTIH